MKAALRILIVATLAPALLYGARPVEGAQVGSQAASNLFQEAMHLEEVVGDLPAAIRLYQRVVEESSTQPSLAAAALVRMGRCYEKLGDAQAREAYDRVVSDYPGELAAATEARSRLAFLQSNDAAGRGPGIVARQVWPDAAGGYPGTVSPDGRYVAFVDWGTVRGHQDLGVYDTETGRSWLLTNWADSEVEHEYVEDIVWSRDGARIAYTRWNNHDYEHKELRVLRADGSDDHILLADDGHPGVIPIAWSRAGDFIVCLFPWDEDGVRIVTISTADGTVQNLKRLGDHNPWPLSLSPDDRYIVYGYPQGEDVPRREELAVHDVFILATDGSSEERLVSHAADDERPFWTPDGGRVVFLSDRSGRPGLYAVEVKDGRPAGDPELVRPEVGDMVTLGFSRSGPLYYKLAARLTDIHVAELDLNLNGGAATLSETSPLTDRWEGTNSLPSWSPDGRWVAFYSRRGQSQGTYAVVKSMVTGEEHDFALPFDSQDENRYMRQGAPTFGSPEWSADGRHLLIRGVSRLDLETGDMAPEAFVQDIVFRSTSTRYFATAVQEEALRAAGIRIPPNGRARRLIDGDLPVRPGETLILFKEGMRRILPGGEVEEIGPRGDVRRWALSPDGTRLAWTVAGRLLMMPVKGGSIREITRLSPSQDADQPRRRIETLQWTPDGQGLLYRVDWVEEPGRKGGFWHVPIEGGAPRRLGLDLPAEMMRMMRFRFHPDGKRVAFWTETRRNELWLMEGFPWQH